jgi:hypothetical protein
MTIVCLLILDRKMLDDASAQAPLEAIKEAIVATELRVLGVCRNGEITDEAVPVGGVSIRS